VKASLTRQGTRKGCADALKIRRFFPPCALHAGAQQTGRRCEESVGSHLIFAAEARYLTLNFYQMMAGKIDKAEEELAPIAIRASRVGAQAIRALAVGALAVGAVALGAVAIGRLAIGGARIKRMEIDELVVKKVRITESLETPIRLRDRIQRGD